MRGLPHILQSCRHSERLGCAWNPYLGEIRPAFYGVPFSTFVLKVDPRAAIGFYALRIAGNKSTHGSESGSET